MNPLQPANGGGYDDAFVAKLNATGSALVYSTYLGGSGLDESYGLAVDSAGNVYITGITYSANFPITPGAFDTSCGSVIQYGCPFVAKLNPSGSALVYSTFSDNVDGAIALDPSGYAYITGGSGADVSKLNPTGSEEVYLYRLSSSGPYAYQNYGTDIAVDSSGTAYVVGVTGGQDFPTVNAVQPVFGGGGSDAFASKFLLALSTTQLTSSANPSVSGKYVTFTATVSAPSGGTPTGTVTFASQAKKTLVGGVARWVPKLSVGTWNITAVYGGDANFSGSKSAITQVVLPATTISLSSSLNPSTYGQAVTFTAVITSANGTPPNGETITFMKGATVLGTGMLSGGSASFTTSTLPGGTDYIKAVYGGDSNFGGSTSQALPQVVNKATTTTTLVSSLNPSSFGQSVTFTATVKPQFSGRVKGSVTYYDGTTVLKADVGMSGGVAKYTTSTLSAGSHNITATYNGNIDFDSSSASLTQKVN
jgi:hypothetical protein